MSDKKEIIEQAQLLLSKLRTIDLMNIIIIEQVVYYCF